MYLMILSYIQREFKYAQMFAITYPKCIENHRDNFYVFLCLFSLSFIFAIYATIVYIGFDPLISIFVLQICGQLEILSHQLLALNEVTDSNEIIQSLKTINIKLQCLYSFIDSLKSNFMILFEYQIKVAIFLVPFALFQIFQGVKLRESIYCCGWEKQSNIKIRKTVLLMMTRCNNPPSIRSVFYPVNLETFSEACRQSYAIFNIMNAAWS
ncbi:PREDICTED: uncharacterized protein LOC106119279 [Papilio xuthus]|uniref:Uncharacterized protein LOC106119279 n=1 Tax=Papilio xuthus TaxID=66420 RepID=A0AAJ6ZCH3_PAPXU|nr:PREDICTED: uncharacterized protein LOC106119279 [Papilio xuthus]